jgi:hypothetical protein
VPIEALVRQELDRIWANEVAWLDEAWARLAERHRLEAEDRLNAVRSVAAELFATTLPTVTVPAIEGGAVENLYRFVPSASVADWYLDPIRRLVPMKYFRHHVLVKAEQSLRRELDKHAGRAAVALGERLEQSWSAFEKSTRLRLDTGVDGILAALKRASRMRDQTEATLRARRERLDEISEQSQSLTL